MKKVIILSFLMVLCISSSFGQTQSAGLARSIINKTFIVASATRCYIKTPSSWASCINLSNFLSNPSNFEDKWQEGGCEVYAKKGWEAGQQYVSCKIIIEGPAGGAIALRKVYENWTEVFDAD